MDLLAHTQACAEVADVLVESFTVALTDAAWALGAPGLKVNTSTAMSRMLPRKKKRLERDILTSFV